MLVMADHAIRAIPLDGSGAAASLTLREAPTSFAADAAGDRIAIGDDGGTITLASPRAAARDQIPPRASLAVCRKRITAVAFVPRRDLVAYACRDGLVGVVHQSLRPDGGA